MQEVFYQTDELSLQTNAHDISWIWIIILPTLGGLSIGLIYYFCSNKDRNGSVSDVIEGAALRNGRVSRRFGLISTAVSLITLTRYFFLPRNGTKSRVAGESMSNKTFHVANWHHNHRTGSPRPSGDREIVGRMERISKGVGWRGVQPEWCMRCSSASTCTALALTVRHASTRQERYASCTKLS